MLIYRPEVYSRAYPHPFQDVRNSDTAMIDIAKGRNIGIHKFICGFDKGTTCFYHLSETKLSDREMEEINTPF